MVDAFNLRNLIRPDLLELPGYVPIEPTDVLAARLREAGQAAARIARAEGFTAPARRIELSLDGGERDEAAK